MFNAYYYIQYTNSMNIIKSVYLPLQGGFCYIQLVLTGVDTSTETRSLLQFYITWTISSHLTTGVSGTSGMK